jgi:branched-chain amino acid aminotransferase
LRPHAQESLVAIVSVWHITPIANISLPVEASSLDEVTRQLPEGYYSTFRTFAGGTRVLGLDAHLRRLFDPVPGAQVDEPFLRRQMRALLGPYRPGEARVRAVMTGEGQVYVALEPLHLLPREVYERGVRAETTDLQREHPQLKSTSFIRRSDSERKHIAQEGIFEALLVKEGRILEGMTSNFFYITRASTSLALEARSAHDSPDALRERGKALCTARDDILLGVTRQTVIDLARGRGLPVRYEPLQRDHLSAMDEAFITSSSRGIVPVIQIDDVTVGEGQPGPVTRELMAAYEAYVLERAEPI